MKSIGTVVLAGGRSSRMGTDKAILPFGSKRLIEHVIDVSRKVSSHLIVTFNKDQYILPKLLNLESQIDITWDSEQGRGPLQGIADSATKMKESVDYYYVLSCDLPYLNPHWLIHLADQMKPDLDVVCTCIDKIANPLLALYKKEVLLSAGCLLKEGKKRPILLWEGKNIKKQIPPKNSLPFGMGVNTQEEFIQALMHRGNANQNWSPN